MSLISVIIPVYNGSKTIRETIESVLKQTYKIFEIIIINDGSQDSTLEIVSTIKDQRLKVFSYDNAGLSASRNRGILQASGEFITFLDADDLWMSDKLESQVKALQEHSEAAVAYSWTNYIDESGKFLYTGNRVNYTGNIYEQLLVHNFIESGSNVLIRKEALEQVGYFDESLCCAEDWDLLIRLAARYHFVVVPSPQILYRMLDNSLSSKIHQQENGCLKVIERAFCQCPESLRYLKNDSLANLYKYLTFRVLVGDLNRKKSITASRCFWLSVRNKPSLFRQQPKLMLIVFIKILMGILVPSNVLQILLTRGKNVTKLLN